MIANSSVLHPEENHPTTVLLGDWGPVARRLVEDIMVVNSYL
jgi:hypothetical protein